MRQQIRLALFEKRQGLLAFVAILLTFVTEVAHAAAMAKTTHTVITDDIDGSADADSYTFSLNGAEYSIDLGEKNAAKLEKALTPFIAKATKVGGRKRSSGGSRSGGRTDLSDVRAWAKKQKLDVSERGRVPKAVLEAYDAAH